MSCNGCRVLRKGCSDTCPLRPCLAGIDGSEAQGHATLFLAKFFGRAGLMGFIAAVPESQRPALFQSLLYEACGRTINPVYGCAGLLWAGQWHVCEAAVGKVLRGSPLAAPSAFEHDAAPRKNGTAGSGSNPASLPPTAAHFVAPLPPAAAAPAGPPQPPPPPPPPPPTHHGPAFAAAAYTYPTVDASQMAYWQMAAAAGNQLGSAHMAAAAYQVSMYHQSQVQAQFQSQQQHAQAQAAAAHPAPAAAAAHRQQGEGDLEERGSYDHAPPQVRHMYTGPAAPVAAAGPPAIGFCGKGVQRRQPPPPGGAVRQCHVAGDGSAHRGMDSTAAPPFPSGAVSGATEEAAAQAHSGGSYHQQESPRSQSPPVVTPVARRLHPHKGPTAFMPGVAMGSHLHVSADRRGFADAHDAGRGEVTTCQTPAESVGSFGAEGDYGFSMAAWGRAGAAPASHSCLPLLS